MDGDRNGAEPTLTLKGDYNEMCTVAALCSYDEAGERVFGTSLEDAEERVRSLPNVYRPAIRRIHRKALVLTGLEQPTADGRPQTDEATEAEKN